MHCERARDYRRGFRAVCHYQVVDEDFTSGDLFCNPRTDSCISSAERGTGQWKRAASDLTETTREILQNWLWHKQLCIRRACSNRGVRRFFHCKIVEMLPALVGGLRFYRCRRLAHVYRPSLPSKTLAPWPGTVRMFPHMVRLLLAG